MESIWHAMGQPESQMQDLGKYDHGVEAIRLEDFTSYDTERQSGRLAKRNRHIDA